MLTRAMNSGVSALNANSQAMAITSHNIANSGTTGFKASNAVFQNSLSTVVKGSSASTATSGGSLPVTVGSGTYIGATITDFSQGSFIETGRSTDLAINGDGFFKVRDLSTNREYATRTGLFSQDAVGRLSTVDRKVVQGLTGGDFQLTATEVGGQIQWSLTQQAPSVVGDILMNAGPISVASGKIINNTAQTDDTINSLAPSMLEPQINERGEIWASLTGNAGSVHLGTVMMMKFKDNTALIAEENGLYSAMDAAGIDNVFGELSSLPGSNGLGKLLSRTVESSNVELTKEFSRLVELRSAFQAGARVVQEASDLMSRVVQLGA